MESDYYAYFINTPKVLKKYMNSVKILCEKEGRNVEKSIKFLESLHIPKDQYIIVGCSGGPDSMCLLDMLHKEGYKIVCAHVNHNIRKESAKEYKFIEKYCNEKKIEFEGLELDSHKKGNESYYRKKRYAFYKSTADQYDTPYIMTAHHGDDLIETVLMRISRGSDIKGYMGFPKVYLEGKYKIVKPLIFYTKKDLIEYDKYNGIPFVHDPSNDDDEYTRNRYRHHLLPFLKEETPNIAAKYLRYSEELEEANNFIEKLVLSNYQSNYKDGILDLNKFNAMDEYLQKKELRHIFKYIYKDDVDKLKVFHIEKIIELIKKETNFTFDLPNGIVATREYSSLRFVKKEEKIEPYCIEFNDSVSLSNGYTISTTKDDDDASNYTIRLNSKDLKFPLYIRNRRAGDKIKIKNMSGTKKVKNIMIDAKIPRSERDSYPLLVSADEEIIWIPGLRKSKFDIKKSEKYDIILKYTKKGKNE